MYDFTKTYSIFWLKDPTASNPKKRRPMVILWKKDDQYFLAKITSNLSYKNKYCCNIENWFEAGLEKPSCVRLDKLINCSKSMLRYKNYIGILDEEDSLLVKNKLETFYKINKT